MDLGNPDLYADDSRYALWQRNVQRDAVLFSEQGVSPSGFWSVFSHRACLEVLDSDAFTSEYGMLIGFDRDHPDRGGNKMLVASEGDTHRRLRRALGRFLTPRSLQRLRAFVDVTVTDLLDEMRNEAGHCDVARQIGPVLPAAVMCEFFGVPQADRDYLIGLTDRAFANPDAIMEETTSAHTDIFLYFHERIEDCRRTPGDDVVSALLALEDIGIDEVLANCYNLLIGGNQTSRHLVSGVFEAAARYPELLDFARVPGRDLRPAVDELLRWVSPGMHVLRIATRPVNLGGERIEEGQAVVAWIAAGNRDPRVFEEPGRLRLDRSPNPHLSFGHGVHSCLGTQLARMEITQLLRQLSARAETVLPAGPVTRTRSNLLQGYRALPVTLRWRELVA